VARDVEEPTRNSGFVLEGIDTQKSLHYDGRKRCSSTSKFVCFLYVVASFSRWGRDCTGALVYSVDECYFVRLGSEDCEVMAYEEGLLVVGGH